MRDHFYEELKLTCSIIVMINMHHFMNDFSTAVIPMEEHTHKNEPAILYCDIEGAGKTLLVKWTDFQVGELCNPRHKICLKE